MLTLTGGVVSTGMHQQDRPLRRLAQVLQHTLTRARLSATQVHQVLAG
jgi:hypothetical protein